MSDGFTLIEIVLVVALFLVIAAVSVVFAAPTLSHFACSREVDSAKLALERARHISQFLKKGNVTVEIVENSYQVRAPGRSGNESVFEEMPRQPSVPVVVVLDTEIVFKEHSGALMLDENNERDMAEIVVGGDEVGCRGSIKVNYAGAIL